MWEGRHVKTCKMNARQAPHAAPRLGPLRMGRQKAGGGARNLNAAQPNSYASPARPAHFEIHWTASIGHVLERDCTNGRGEAALLLAQTWAADCPGSFSRCRLTGSLAQLGCLARGTQTRHTRHGPRA